VLVLATSGISRTSALGADSTKANESAISVFEILDRKSKIDSSSEEGMVVASMRGNIEFQNVCFHYPLRPSVQIFNNLSLNIPSGQVTFYLN
jgi:ATP-binding cassette subfamily B (MDR/TAP) protein 1